jgi:uncharacterized protein (DUF1697 family)
MSQGTEITMTGTRVALMRGINVGGRNKLPMKDLAAVFEDVGCLDVRTYIQSGNVVLRGGPEPLERLASLVTERIAQRFGFRTPVVVRTAEQLRAAVEANPFLAASPDPRHLHVGFLAELPSSEAVAGLEPARSTIDRFAVRGREVYLHVPGGMGRTKLTNDWFDRHLGVTMTVRNWRTVNALVDMSETR